MNNLYIGRLDINENISSVKVIDALHFALEESDDTEFISTLTDQINDMEGFTKQDPEDTWAGQDAEGNAY